MLFIKMPKCVWKTIVDIQDTSSSSSSFFFLGGGGGSFLYVDIDIPVDEFFLLVDIFKSLEDERRGRRRGYRERLRMGSARLRT